MNIPAFLVPLLLTTIGVASGLTALIRRYALSTNLLDRPNERSSHTVPTPRGGGVAIVASFLLLVVEQVSRNGVATNQAGERP